MTAILQAARAMREMLTTNADDAAHATRFVQRQSSLGGATLSQTLVFGGLAIRKLRWKSDPKRPRPAWHRPSMGSSGGREPLP
jgi:hypothetical protein